MWTSAHIGMQSHCVNQTLAKLQPNARRLRHEDDIQKLPLESAVEVEACKMAGAPSRSASENWRGSLETGRWLVGVTDRSAVPARPNKERAP